MIASLSTWRETFEDLPLVGDKTWVNNYVNWIAGNVAGMTLENIKSKIPEFRFNPAPMVGRLRSMEPTDSTSMPAAAFAAALAASITASQMIVLSGASLGSASPATIWSIVNGSIAVLDAPSLVIATNNVRNGLQAATSVGNARQSRLPELVRNAFLSLTYTITGVNSITPTPAPLVAPQTPTK